VERRTEPVSMWFDARLAMRHSPVHGTGTFATDLIRAGEELMRVSGGIVYTTEDWKTGRVVLDGSKYNEEKIGDDLFVAVPVATFYYLNHSCDPNMWLFTARRDIQPGEELTIDYALCESSPHYRLEPCLCGSSLCRGRLTGNDWQLPELQSRYAGHFSPYVERLIRETGVR
jgi:uncharacterized protein